MSEANFAVQVKEFSDDPISAAQVAQIPVPEPGVGEVVVKIYLRPVNPADVFSLQGESTHVSSLCAHVLRPLDS